MYQSDSEATAVTPLDVPKGQRRKPLPIIYIVGPIAALAGLLFGMDIGVISGALPLIAEAFHASDLVQEMIVAAMMAGAAVGAIGGGWLSHRFGRRVTLLISGVIFVVGAVGCAVAMSSMFATRRVSGRVRQAPVRSTTWLSARRMRPS